ncbi:MAG: sulfite exporter TauE/SafE family protein [Phycisphaerales bacterium]|nr:sulfite exporter TauE/SafE family protein [Phycisphaerae bacterium]NNF42412.1 sulfite exporter TauE/SafE family protein [Phycisphaerales bacterium]NNM26183.1 sulfite exporter TauE/SafE family protein [Phycisphaerales bacterium]
MSWPELLILLLLGLAAGTLGGLLGIGGSVLMIPVLTLVLYRDQHLSQAAAMIINAFVALPATLRHHRAGAVPWDVVRRLLPGALIFIVIGVEVSDQFDGSILMRVFGVFLIYVIYVNVQKLLHKGPAPDPDNGRSGWLPVTIVGSITGFAAGLLGIGGGIITVPLLQRVAHLPLRRAIAGSATIMCVTAVIGATRKNLTLDVHGLPVRESLLIAACLAPTALVGGHLGACLTHALPLRVVRLVLVILLAVASAKFLGLF